MDPLALFSPAARVVVVAAHPDDEIIGCGALLARLPVAMVMHVTDGAPRDGCDAAKAGFTHWRDYANRRREEALAALALAGIASAQVTSGAIADQQASLALAPLARRIAALLREQAATTVITHAYEGGHPDHDAAAFATHLACRSLARRPHLFEMTGYHACGGAVVSGAFIPHADAGPVLEFALDEEAARLKRRMLECHATQHLALAPLALAPERLRRAPRYDFRQAPHRGQLHYERHDWCMDGVRWRSLVAAALEELRGCA